VKRQEKRLRKRTVGSAAEQAERRARKRAIEVVTAYAEVARPIMLWSWTPASCIAATRVTVNVLGAYGISARPYPVAAMVYNRAYMRLAARLGRWPEIEEQHADPAGAWSLGVGVEGDPDDPRWSTRNGYDGHLVALALNDTLLLDASLDQASRPERDIELRPSVVVTECTPEFLKGEVDVRGETRRGVVVVYRRRENPQPWEDTPGWQVTRHGPVEIAIVKAMIAKGVAP
jgi:hypothetical protein